MSRYSLTQWQILCYTLSEPLRTRPTPSPWISNELGKKFANLEDFEADEKESSIDEAPSKQLPPDWWGSPASDNYMRVFSWLAWETRKLTQAEQETILRVVEQVRKPSGVPALPLRDRPAAAGAALRPEQAARMSMGTQPRAARHWPPFGPPAPVASGQPAVPVGRNALQGATIWVHAWVHATGMPFAQGFRINTLEDRFESSPGTKFELQDGSQSPAKLLKPAKLAGFLFLVAAANAHLWRDGGLALWERR